MPYIQFIGVLLAAIMGLQHALAMVSTHQHSVPQLNLLDGNLNLCTHVNHAQSKHNFGEKISSSSNNSLAEN